MIRSILTAIIRAMGGLLPRCRPLRWKRNALKKIALVWL